MGIGDWGLGIGDWGLGIGANPQFKNYIKIFYNYKILNNKFISMKSFIF